MDTAPDQARSLHEVFASLAGDTAGDPGAALAAAGHGELPADLLNEAVVSYAEVSPPEVAEHLSPVVLGASEDPGLALELLSSAPQVSWDDVPEEPVVEAADAADDVPDLDFGLGDEGPDDLGGLDQLDDLGDLDDLDAPAATAPAGDVPAFATGEAGDDLALPEDAEDLSAPGLADEGWDVDPAWDDTTDGSDDLDF
jgi:hypothetical protein